MFCALINLVISLTVFHFSYAALLFPNNRLSEVEWNNYNYPEPTGQGSYAYGYDIEDSATNNVQFKNEERHANGTVTGNYGYLLPNGNVQKVSYVADSLGYRASVEIVPRGILKPVLLDAPENQLFDFSSQIPPRKPQISPAPVKQGSSKLYPYNIPKYVSANLNTHNDLELSYKQKRPLVITPYYSTLLKTDANFKKQFDNHYLIPVRY